MTNNYANQPHSGVPGAPPAQPFVPVGSQPPAAAAGYAPEQSGGWQQPAPQGHYYGWQPAPKRSAWQAALLPTGGQVYATAMRPLSKRLGRWFAAGAVAVGFFAIGQAFTILLLTPMILGESLSFNSANPMTDINEQMAQMLGTPLGMLAVNLSWAVMIPGAILAGAMYGKGGAGLAISVAGRWRWSLMARSLAIIAPIFAIYIAFSFTMMPDLAWRWNPNWWLLLVVLLTTPLQSAGEEFAFRGFLTQAWGGWIPSPVVASIVIGAITGLIFGAMHGHSAISVTLQLSLVGFTCSMLTWRTGGLEAACVLHACNNVFIMAPLAFIGQSAFSAGGETNEDWLGLGVTVLALGLSYAGVHFFLRREQRTTVANDSADALLAKPAQGGVPAQYAPRYAPAPSAPAQYAPMREPFGQPSAPPPQQGGSGQGQSA